MPTKKGTFKILDCTRKYLNWIGTLEKLDGPIPKLGGPTLAATFRPPTKSSNTMTPNTSDA